MTVLPNFSRAELSCRCGCGLARFAPGFLQALQGLRDAMEAERIHSPWLRASMVLSSACRCDAHNRRPVADGGAGGHPRSLHVGDLPHWPTGGCCAVDVRADEGTEADYRARLARLALARGWRVGYAGTFIHLDMGTVYAGLPQAQFRY